MLLVQASGPPYPGGTNVILKRLLEDLPGWSIAPAVNSRLRRAVRRGDPLALESAYRYFLRIPPIPWLAPIAHLANGPLALLAGLRLVPWARRSGAVCVVTAIDGGFSQVAAAVTARLAGLPLVVLVFDLWEENAYGRSERLGARLFERRLFRSAAEVVVFSAEAADHYRGKHGIEPSVLRIPLPSEAEARDGHRGPQSVRADEPAEVFAGGAVYWAQEDAIRRLSSAVARVERARLTVIGQESRLRSQGIVADRYEARLLGDDFRRRVADADVLALGLSFGSPHPQVIRTATPARLVEYMASGTPLLVHAPAGSHVAEYARSEDFAEVVDEASIEAVAAGVERIVANPDLAQRRAARAMALAASVHDGRRIRGELRALLLRHTAPK
ncbi:MAG: glycosyltransferase [Thermoleophilaceae bacterium]